ncbi:DNA cytosine methyltransferase [Gryllotalpicola koreensis]|uniref:DNA (cytosine-5-)-methyltransferase n=1 Tax=Gryllotalpicola koreensis TaxID=993086 RepID=A0ABP8A2X8_9MICO
MSLDITVSDFFAGAGGSSTGMIQVPGVKIRIAANHNKTVTEIHNWNHPDTDHSVVDLHQERPSFFPKTTIGWFSPECTKWSQANGSKLPAIEEGLFEDPLSDDVKTRSRLLMFDVLKFIEYHRYRLVFVENVVDIATQAQYRTAWTVWRQELRALGYNFRVVSLNSMHAQTFGLPAPQSRDRIYIVAWPEGERPPELDRILRPKAYCTRCDVVVESVQSFKPNRSVGRYRQAYIYCCSRCGRQVEPGWLPAASAIDWSIPGERIGDRLKPKTRARIAAGIARYWGPLIAEAAGNTYDAADPKHPNHGELEAYYRAWPIEDALKSLTTTATKALVNPLIVNHVSGSDESRAREISEVLPALVAGGMHASLLVPVEARDGKQAQSVDQYLRTLTTRAETALVSPFLAEMYGTSTSRSVDDPMSTVAAGGNHHMLVDALVSQFRDRADRNLYPMTDPLRTIVADGAAHALIHRNNSHGSHGSSDASMSTPVTEYLRTITTSGNVSLIQHGEMTGKPRVSAADLKAAEELVPEALFRMLEPHEIAAGMAFPADYKWQSPDRVKPISKRDLVKAAGNAVTPPSARDLLATSVESLGVAA